MSDLIRREDAISVFTDKYPKNYMGDPECGGLAQQFSLTDIKHILYGLPSAKTEIIRCKYCKHYNAGFECLIEGYGIERDADWFCGDAERRTE